jgi:ADP-heptose:LPS heptosyltransferase
MGFLSGAQITAGYYIKEPWRNHLISHKVYYNHYRHISEIFMALGASLNASSKDLSLQKPVIPAHEREHLNRIFEAHGVKKSDWKVVVNVNTSWLSSNRCWPLSHFSHLIKRMAEVSAVKIILIGATGDISRVEELCAVTGNSHKVVNLAGKTNIPQLLALLDQVDLVLSNDSGPLHLAVMMGTPTISFFGPESPVQYGPREEKHTILYKGYYCSPCLHVYNEKNSSCEDNICLKDISVDEVFAVVEKYHTKWEHTSNEKN